MNKLKKIETVEEHRRGADRFGELSPSDVERVVGALSRRRLIRRNR